MKIQPENTGNWFVDKLNLYQAANTDNESLKRNFVVRTHEFNIIIDDLRQKKGKDPLQHELVLGRRGSGKSTLLKRLQIAIEEDPKLSERYVAVNLAEEQASIYRLSDLWFEVLQELSIKTQNTLHLRAFSSFTNNQDYTRYLYAQIHELLQKNAKKAVLLLDNFDRILENLDDDAHLLREILQNHNDLQIVGGSTRLDEHFWRYDQPFYEFFRRHRLEALTFDEIPQLKEYALQNRGKIEALRILTDGLPRTLQFFIQILLQDHNLYGYDYIKKVMDKATPIYQERLNSLSPAHRKIVLELAFLWEAASTKQLVDKCRMESKALSSFLKQLYSYGIIEKIETSTKNHLYRIAERFFGMWLIVTQGNPDQKRKAKFLTIFLETWYDGHKLQDLASSYLTKLKNQEIGFDKAAVLSKAFSQSKYITTAQRDELISHTLQLPKSNLQPHDLPETFGVINAKIIALDEAGKYEEALALLDEIENEEDGIKFFGKGFFNDELKNFEDAEKYYGLAIEKGHIDALHNLALLYDNQGKLEEAEKYYLLAIEKRHIKALHNLALLYYNQGKLEDAERYYLLAIEKGNINALNNLALMYENQGKLEDAERYYLLAIEKGNINALYNLALMYDNQGKLKDAEKYYLLAIEKGHIDALYNLALIYQNQGKSKEAEKYYLLAIEKGVTDALNNLAVMYLENNQNRSEALALIQRHNKVNENVKSRQSAFLIEIWNGIFENVRQKMEAILAIPDNPALNSTLKCLLYLEQKNLVLSCFRHLQYGAALQAQFAPLYYATLLLCEETEDNVALRIPPEIVETVNEIVEEVREKNAFYAKG
jgi:TPR repeat protein/energy-coupling factor transporter ATP-binding protein EcfA2